MPELPTNSDSPQMGDSCPPSYSASIRQRIINHANQLGRELTSEEMAMILAADVYAHRNWHNLGSSETVLIAMLERAGYLATGGQGFTGGPSLPQTVHACPGCASSVSATDDRCYQCCLPNKLYHECKSPASKCSH